MRPKTMKIVIDSDVAHEVTRMLNASEKSQYEIAEEIGLTKSNIMTMFKQGRTKVPLALAPKLAKACGANPAEFMNLCLKEYQPAILEAMSEASSSVVDESELHLLRTIRKAKNAVEDKERTKAKKGAKTEYEVKRANLVRVGYDTSPKAMKALFEFTKKELLT